MRHFTNFMGSKLLGYAAQQTVRPFGRHKADGLRSSELRSNWDFLERNKQWRRKAHVSAGDTRYDLWPSNILGACPAPNRLIRAVLMLSLAALALPGQNSSYRPGATDPAGNPANLTLFGDEQLFVMSPGTTADRWKTATASFDQNVIPTATVSNLPWSSAIPFEQVDIQAVAGRIVHPDRDEIVIAQRSEKDRTKLAVRFRDGSGESELGNLSPRVSGWTDFFATSEGDLDRLYDPEGNYHDEVVAAWMEAVDDGQQSCRGTDFVPHLAVLNYNDGANPSVLAQPIERDDRQYLQTCELEGYNENLSVGAPVPRGVLQPVDNIIATAVGDFDGDGYNEIAVGYMRGQAGVVISVVIYRYQNDGKNVSLTPVNTIELYRPERSMVGTLSLAAGDFDGSGVDQLLVGSAYWWGTPVDNQDGHVYGKGTLVTQPVFSLIKGGQVSGSITGAASTGTDSASTEFTVSLGNGKYVPRTVTISGATGNWAAINGTWPVTVTEHGFSIGVDSTQFGSFDGQDVAFTAAAPLTHADSVQPITFPGLGLSADGPIHIDESDRDGRIRVQMVPGLFHFDPREGFDYRRRQVAVAWNARPEPSQDAAASRDGDPHVGIIQVTPDDKLALATVENGGSTLGPFQTFQSLSLAAGAFRGDNDVNDPTWSLFVSGLGQGYVSGNLAEGLVYAVLTVTRDDTDPNKLHLGRPCTGKATADPYSPAYYGFEQPVCQIWGDTAIDSPTGSYPFPVNNYLRLPAIAADLNGNSLRLGAPVHFEITNPGKADYILEQPPQHSAWLDRGDGKPKVVTLNRYPTFNTSMQDSQKKDFASKSQDHLDWTVGGSLKLTASQSTSVGAKGEVFGEELEATATGKLSISGKVAYDFDHVSSDYNSNYDSYSVGRGAVTGEDDSLEGVPSLVEG